MLTPYVGLKFSLLITVLLSPVIILFSHIVLSRLVLLLKSNRPPQFICVMAVLFGNILFLIVLFFLCYVPAEVGRVVPDLFTVPSMLYAFMVYNLMGT